MLLKTNFLYPDGQKELYFTRYEENQNTMCCVNTYSATLNTLQRNFIFSATFNVLSLAGSNNLLTHTHTFRHLSLGVFLRAREAQCIPYKQRAQVGSLCSIVYTPLQDIIKRNKQYFHSILTNKFIDYEKGKQRVG